MKKTKSKECPYSPDCFRCPLPDCRIKNGVTNLNMLPNDYERHTTKRTVDVAQLAQTCTEKI